MIIAKKVGACGMIVSRRNIIAAEYEAQTNKGVRRQLRTIGRQITKIEAAKQVADMALRAAAGKVVKQGMPDIARAEQRAERRAEYEAKCTAKASKRYMASIKAPPVLVAKEPSEAHGIVLNGPATSRGNVTRFEARWCPLKQATLDPIMRAPNFKEFSEKAQINAANERTKDLAKLAQIEAMLAANNELIAELRKGAK